MAQPDPFDLLFRKLESHAALTDDDKIAVRALPVRQRTLEPSSYIVREGEPPSHCAVVLSGFAFRQKLTGNGARQIVSVHVPGEPLDFQSLFLEVADHNIQALTRADVAFFPRADIQALMMARPGFARAVIATALVEASIFREWIVNVGRRDSRAALAHLLCEFATRLKGQGLLEGLSYDLPMTQEQLADALGLTSVHVNRTMRALEADGLISRHNRRLTIPDWKALRDMGDFNARYLHLPAEDGGSGG